mmetsp:Transcript_29513/g.82444  ORF Transcript_29513/g.82444 Transcript_29513/m.82444 type:complete len:1441 (+) Transcript_29513:70-4392(+)
MSAGDEGGAKPAASKEEDKHQLNPTPKGGKKVHSKPVKIGFLDVEEGTLLRKRFKNKFCLLTDNRELEWYRRQEDQVERKVQGSVKNLDECSVDEYDGEYLGSSCCFTVKVHGKTFTFGAANDMERINWMVEILKLRTIQFIIDLLNHPRLSRHAAYALCNQAGNKKGDVQTDIVTLGGVDGLIAIVNEYVSEDELSAESDDLLKSIYYAVQKLAENEKNKKRIGKHMSHFFAVLVNDKKPDYWRGFAAQCIVKCIENDVNKKLLRGVKGIEKLAHTLTGERAKEPLLKDVCKALLMLCQDAESRVTVGKQLDVFVEALGTVPNPVKPIVVSVIIASMESEEVLQDVIAHQQVIPRLITLLVSPSKEVQEAVSKLLLLLSQHDVKKLEIQNDFGLNNLIACSCSPSPLAAETALRALESFLSHQDNVEALGKLEMAEVTQLITTLEKEESQILAPSSSIFLILSKNDMSRFSIGARAEGLTRALLEGLYHARHAEEQATTERALEAMANFATTNLVQLVLCRGPILAKLVEELGTDSFPPSTLRSVVTIVASCSSYPNVVKELGSGVVPLAGLLKSEDEKIQENAASAIADLCHSDVNCNVAADNQAVKLLATALCGTDTVSLQLQLLRALANICHDAKKELQAQSAISKIVRLVSTSKSREIVHASALALQNLSSQKDTLEAIELPRLSEVLVTSTDAWVRATIAVVIRNVLHLSRERVLPVMLCESSPETVRGLVQAASDGSCVRLTENSLWALSYVSGAGLEVIGEAGGLPLCVKVLAENKSFPAGEYAATILENCLRSGVDKSTLFADEAWDNFIQGLAIENVKTLEKLASALASCARSIGSPAEKAKLVRALRRTSPLLKFPNIQIHKAIAEAMILAAKDANGDIVLADVGGLQGMLSLLEADGCKGTQLGTWALTTNNAQGVIELKVSGQPAGARFSFANPEQTQTHLAYTLASAYYGDTMRMNPFQSMAPPPAALPKALDGVEDLPDPCDHPAHLAPDMKKRGSSNFVSIGGARKRPADAQKGEKSPKAAPWGRNGTFSAPANQQPTRHHLLAWASYAMVFDERVAYHKGSVDGYLRASCLKVRPQFELQWPESADKPSALVSTAGQDAVVIENSLRVLSNFEAIGPSGRYRTGMVTSEHPFLLGLKIGIPLAYFEVLVLSRKGSDGCVGVGLCAGDYPRDQQPGWQPNAFGYHSDDGNKYEGGKNEAFGPTFGCHDVVGCGIDMVTNSIFFTKNGFLLGTAFPLPENVTELFPCVALSGGEQHAYANFGQQPFLFDFNFSNTLEFIAAPKAVPGGRPEPPNSEETYRCSLYSRNFDKIARVWSFMNPTVSTALENSSNYMQQQGSGQEAGDGIISCGRSSENRKSLNIGRGAPIAGGGPPPTSSSLTQQQAGRPGGADDEESNFGSARAMWGARAAANGVPPRPNRFAAARK